MPKSLPDDLGKILADHERRLNALSSGNRLDHASLDGTTLYIKDEDGSLRGRLGRQPDGSFGNVTVRVEPPPQPTAAILTVGDQAGTCQVKWDGGTFDGRRVPIVFGHVEVWAELVGGDWVPTVAPSDAAGRVGTIRDRTGGEVTVALPQAGTWAVWLRLVGADRETAGPWSPVSTVEITPLVDTEAIEQELEEARDRLEQAEQDLAAGMADRKAEIDYLREERIPALQDALNTGLDDVYREAQQYAEAQASDAVNQAAANAQSEYDRLQEIAERALSRAGDNVLEDPSFETDYWFDQWETFGSNPRTLTPTEDARTGDQAMIIGNTGANVYLPLGVFDVEPDDTWRLTIWYRTSSNFVPNLTRLTLRHGNSDIAESEPFQVSSGEYSRAVLNFTVPDGVETLDARLLVRHDTGTLIVDDVAFQEVGAAAEALRMAEVARQQAEAAHIAAGNAVDTAANAYDAASSKSTVHWSLSAPSGTADNTDDVWWQYELRNGKRVVIGQWFWDNGVWRETEIAEEWLPRVNIGTGTYGDLHGDRLEANTVKAGALAVMPDSADFAPGPGGYEDLWTVGSNNAIVSSGSDPSGAQLRVSPSGSTASRTHGPWIRAQAGDTIYYRMYVGRTGSPDAALRIYFMYDGSYTSWQSVWVENASGWVEGVHTVRSDVESTVALSFYAPGGSQGNYWIRNMEVRKQVKGVLIEPEGIKSPQVDTEEFFAAQAVIEKIWADIVRSRLIQSEGIITEDMIATGAITTPKLTVTEEMVGELARFLKIEAGSLASNDIEAMRIVSSLIEATTYLIHNADGDVSVRLDGVNNYLAGRIHAGMDEGRGIELDYELIEVDDDTNGTDPGDGDESEDTHQIVAPYLRFRTDHNHRQVPRMWVGTQGNLNVNPGRVGTQHQSETPFRIWGEARANVMSAASFIVKTRQPDQNGGLIRDGERTQLAGRAPGYSLPRQMFTTGVLGAFSPSSGQYKGTMTFSNPPVRGQRTVMVTGGMSAASIDAWRSATATVGGHSSTGFQYTLTTASGGNNMWLYYNGVWD